MITKEDLFSEIVTEVEVTSQLGIAGHYVKQVPEGFDYTKHWPIMAAVEIAFQIFSDVWEEGFAEGWDAQPNDLASEHPNPYEEVN